MILYMVYERSQSRSTQIKFNTLKIFNEVILATNYFFQILQKDINCNKKVKFCLADSETGKHDKELDEKSLEELLAQIPGAIEKYIKLQPEYINKLIEKYKNSFIKHGDSVYMWAYNNVLLECDLKYYKIVRNTYVSLHKLIRCFEIIDKEHKDFQEYFHIFQKHITKSSLRS